MPPLTEILFGLANDPQSGVGAYGSGGVGPGATIDGDKPALVASAAAGAGVAAITVTSSFVPPTPPVGAAKYVQQYGAILISFDANGALVSADDMSGKAWWNAALVLLACNGTNLVFSNGSSITSVVDASTLASLAGPFNAAHFSAGSTSLDFCSNAAGGFYWTAKTSNLVGTGDSLLGAITSVAATFNGGQRINRYQPTNQLHREQNNNYDLYDPTAGFVNTISYSPNTAAANIAGIASSPVTDVNTTAVLRAVTSGSDAKILVNNFADPGVQTGSVTLYTASNAVRWHGLSADASGVFCITRDALAAGTSDVKAYTVTLPGLVATDVSSAVQAAITAGGAAGPTSQLFMLNRGY